MSRSDLDSGFRIRPGDNGTDSMSSSRRHELARRVMFFGGAGAGVAVGAGVTAFGPKIGAKPSGVLTIVFLGVGWIFFDAFAKLMGDADA